MEIIMIMAIMTMCPMAIIVTTEIMMIKVGAMEIIMIMPTIAMYPMEIIMITATIMMTNAVLGIQ